MNLLEAIAHPELFAPWFRDHATWAAWRAFIATLFAYAFDDEQLAIYRKCTHRIREPQEAFKEAWLVIGRRGGKSFIMALVAVFLACFRDYRPYLTPGERGTVLVIAADRKQARVILRYVRALLTRIPALAKLIERDTADGFDLTNSVTIEVATANFRTVRGYTIVAALCDEMAFWRSEESASPDVEVLAAIRPGMATIPTAMLLCASSPHARSGALWEAYQQHYGKDRDPVLVWQAPTLTMNPSVPAADIEKAYEEDPAWAAAEYGAEFRKDIEQYLSREAVDRCIDSGVTERPADRDHHYVGFVDPSGGSADSFTLAIAHSEGRLGSETQVLDLLRETRPPFSPEAVVAEYADIIRSYRISTVEGDAYAGEWPREQFRRNDVTYRVSEQSRSELYIDLLPLVMSRAVRLLDSNRLVTQLVTLDRRTMRGGRETIDHRRGGHDDLANVAAGALVRAWRAEDRPLPRIVPMKKPVFADPLAAWR